MQNVQMIELDMLDILMTYLSDSDTAYNLFEQLYNDKITQGIYTDKLFNPYSIIEDDYYMNYKIIHKNDNFDKTKIRYTTDDGEYCLIARF